MLPAMLTIAISLRTSRTPMAARKMHSTNTAIDR
jgi:hypothetical protein